jgi:ligand-binding sensor domain-containing protein
MRTLLLISLLWLSALAAQAQQPFMRDLWLNESNAPVKINDMQADEHGYIWLATDDGLYRFNGRSVTLLGSDVSVAVTAVTSFNGNVWAGYKDGTLGMVQGNEVHAVKVAGNAGSSAITSLQPGGRHLLWATTEENGVLAIMAGRVASLNVDKGLSDNFVYKISSPDGQKLLAGTDRGLNIMGRNNGKLHITQVTMQQGLADNIVRVLSRIPKSNSYWLGMQQGGVAIYNTADSKVINPPMAEPWHWGQVNDILPVSPRRAWIATEEGYLLQASLQGDSLHIEATQLENKRIYKLLCGRSGIIWCATNMGLTLVTAEYMNAIPMKPPYSIGTIRAMACDKNNTLWYAQDNTLYSLALPAVANAPHQSATLPAEISSLYADAEGRLWIGTLGAGVWMRGVTGTLQNIKGIEQLDNGSILDISGTADRIWVSGLNGVEELSYPGLYTQQVQLIKHHNKRSGIGSDYVYQVFADHKDRMWMATDGAGVCMYSSNSYHKWDTAQGMLSKVVYNIAEDAIGDIWAATLDDGLMRYNGKNWQQLSRAQGLQDVKISTIAANATGQLVVVHAQGIDVWYPGSNQFRNYSPRQGFGIDSVSGVLKLYANDRDGNVYIPYQGGFIVFKNIESYYDIRPLVNITSVSAAFRPVPQGRNTFDYSENFISFRYEGVNFANPEMLHYRYKLEGYNDNWTVTNDESATFPQLPDGEYTFHVQASLNSNFTDYGGGVYTFTVNKPYWKKAWFIVGLLLLIVGGIYIYQRIRERNLTKVAQLQSERMKFEYEHLKSQVNPHFLFNSLNTLTSLIDENADAATEYTARLSDLYRNMLAYRDKDLILLAEEWEILDNYMYIQKTRFGDALRLDAQVPESYMRSRKIVPLALQLLVENAIKHNVVSRSRPLTITINVTDEYIIITNPIQQKLSKEKSSGLGLINIKKRYSLLSKKNIIFGIENNHYKVILPLL